MRVAAFALCLLLATQAVSFGSPPGRGPDAARLVIDLYAALDSAGLCNSQEISCQQVDADTVVIHAGDTAGHWVTIQANRNAAGAPATVFLWTDH